MRFYSKGINNAVSIHAFRGEGDKTHSITGIRLFSFNPRLPGGRRLTYNLVKYMLFKFQSTPSGGKATRIAL